MSSGASMPCLLMLVLTTNVCLAQRLYAAGVAPAPELDCPLMSELGSSASLQTAPWAFARTINVMQQGAPNQRSLGQVRATPFSWTSEFVLHHPQTNKEITKIVNPLGLWDTTQEIYNCQGQLMGKLTYPFDWKNMFSNRYLKHRVLDAQGNHIASLVQEQFTSSFFASPQHFIYLQDVNGNALASMRHPSGGWRLNPFGEYFDTQIVMESLNAQAPPPATNPEFLSLIFANALASENRLGPYASMIVYPALILLFCICMVCMCGGFKKVASCLTCCGICTWICGKRESRKPTVEENETLIEKESKAVKRDVWSCCSRRQVAPGGDAPKK